MLVLSRQRDESIIIGDDIVITIVTIRGNEVRIGISAPTNVPVHRVEIYEAVQRQNLVAAGLNPEEWAATLPVRVAEAVKKNLAARNNKDQQAQS